MLRFLAPIVAGALTVSGLVVMSSAPAQATTATVVVHVQGATYGADGSPANAASTLSVNGATVATYSGSDTFGAFAITSATAGAPVTFKVGGTTYNPYDLTQGTEIWLATANPSAEPTRALAQGSLIVHVPTGSGTPTATGAVTGPAVQGTSDTFGDVYSFPIDPTGKEVDVTLNGETSAHIVRINHFGEVWLKAGDTATYESLPWANGFAVIHYHRADGNYTGWGLHVWTGYRAGPSDPAVTWGTPFPQSGTDPYGVYFKVPLAAGATSLSWIIHQGNNKDLQADQSLDLAKTGGEVWFNSGTMDSNGAAVFDVPVIHSVDADLTKAKAIWLTPTTIAWPFAQESASQVFTLKHSPTANIAVNETTISGGTDIPLTYAGQIGNDLIALYPNLSNYYLLKLPNTVTAADVKSLLHEQNIVTSSAADGVTLEHASGVQIGPVLDSLYHYTGALGTTFTHDGTGAVTGITIRVWAPTATTMKIQHFSDASTVAPVETVDMTYDGTSGVWSYNAPASWLNTYYLYEDTVYAPTTDKIEDNVTTDPYSLGLSMNSARTLIVDLSQPDTKPAGWDKLAKPKLASLADASIYELHIRDFSAYDQSVPANLRGTYEAFAQPKSNGMRHLAALAKAGLTHVHILPFFDITSINEDPAKRTEISQQTLQAAVAAEGPASQTPQQLITANAANDAYNWGYDPWHYTAPEGSYSTNPNGSTRNKQVRDMVMGLNKIGLRIVMDVVYNHTTASGENPHSVLDEIVPGYYYRLMPDGSVATSTCCQNTATERYMMAKLVRDSILTWATAYKIDGFRFDIMGHMPYALLIAIRNDLNKLTIAKDGVDGKKIILYGEGWNFGEVANNARFLQATQANMAGTGIGTFDDRIRDAVRGGTPFDNNPRAQGFGSGLYTLSNGDAINGNSRVQKSTLLSEMDAVKLGMAGEEAGYSFVDSSGQRITGLDLLYNNGSAGYTDNPVDQIAYVDAHDNEILFDSLAYKLPYKTAAAIRARYQVVSLATVLLGQGIPFMAAGSDLLHSKSLDKNSYDSSDWFNAIDWTGANNGFGQGLPQKGDNFSRWTGYSTPALNATKTIKPSKSIANLTSNMIMDLLRIRYSSPLFRLGTLKNVQARLTYIGSGPNQTPGVITMRLLDAGAVGASKKLANLDKNYKSIIVVINASAKTTNVTSSVLKNSKISLDPIQARGADAIVKKSKYTAKTGTLTVPAQTVAVFVQK